MSYGKINQVSNIKYINNKLLYNIKKKKLQNNGIHIKTALIMFFTKIYKNTKLTCCVNKRSGCSSFGSKTIWSKCSKKKYRKVLYANTFKNSSIFIYIAGLFKNASSVKIAAHMITSSGAMCYVPLTTRMFLFRIQMGCNFFTELLRSEPNINILWRCCEVLYKLPHATAICYIAPQYNTRILFSKATASSSITHKTAFFKKNKIKTQIFLASGLTKEIDSSVCVLLGHIVPTDKNKFINTKAGYWRNLGKKPTVRGVVKNPIDHPHGGRERTIAWQRTPWGKSTK